MFGFGVPELLILLVILLIVVGPAKLPQLGGALGGALRSFRKGAQEEERREIDADV
uniref:Sec-independent protein translocase protein TatA n=1 Tax=Geobacter sp. (strain M21) TaxID=443144 RepID=C6E1Y8_GEOSM